MTYQCIHCSRTFSSPYSLKRHISDKHQYISDDEGEASYSNRLPYEESDLWDDNLPTDDDIWDDDLPTEDQTVRVR